MVIALEELECVFIEWSLNASAMLYLWPLAQSLHRAPCTPTGAKPFSSVKVCSIARQSGRLKKTIRTVKAENVIGCGSVVSN
jgi:hypothetical protein